MDYNKECQHLKLLLQGYLDCKSALENAILSDMAWQMRDKERTNIDLKEAYLKFLEEAREKGDPTSLTEALSAVRQAEFERRMDEARENYAREVNQIGIDLGYTL